MLNEPTSSPERAVTRKQPHPNSLANLKKGSFKPGQSGNARGRRKGIATTQHAVERMSLMTVGELLDMDEASLPAGVALIRSRFLKALDPRASYSDRAADELLDRLIGKATRTDTSMNEAQQTEYHISVSGQRFPSYLDAERERAARVALEGYEKPVAPLNGTSATQDTGTSLQPVETDEERWAGMSPDERFKAEQAALLKRLQDEKYGERKEVGKYSREYERVSMSWEKFESYNHVPRGSRLSENLRSRD